MAAVAAAPAPTAVVDLLFQRYPVNRFDALAIRINNFDNAAEGFDINRFQVEVVEAVVPPTPFPITSVQRVGADDLILTWGAAPGRTYEVQSRGSLTLGDWVSGPPVTAAGASQSYTNSGISGMDARYYRVIVP